MAPKCAGKRRGFSLVFVVTMLAILSFGATLLLARSAGVALTAGSRSQAVGADNLVQAGANSHGGGRKGGCLRAM